MDETEHESVQHWEKNDGQETTEASAYRDAMTLRARGRHREDGRRR
jgi:hypothetical protein